MPIERRLEARRVLKNAKAQDTPPALVNEAMVCMVNVGATPKRLSRRLRRWGFDEAETNTLITKHYPQNPS